MMSHIQSIFMVCLSLAYRGGASDAEFDV
jgi:hypothetical protein